MKAAGIIRNLDKLGRVVLPKELRTVFNINPGDPLEIFTDDDGSIIIRKYQIDDALIAAVKNMRNTVDSYGDNLPRHVAEAIKKHLIEVKALIEEEASK